MLSIISMDAFDMLTNLRPFAAAVIFGWLTGCSSSVGIQNSTPADSPAADSAAQQESVSHQCLSQPIQTCTASSPCSNGTETFNSPSSIPACSLDGGALSFMDAQGTSRYYCRSNPSGLSTLKPLVIFLHGGTRTPTMCTPPRA